MSTPPIWRGNNYNGGGIFGTRILVLGESTYPAPGEDTSTYNVAIPQDHISGRRRDAFRTKLLRVFINADHETSAQISAFWHSITFFNYIIEPQIGSRIAPAKQAWATQHHPLEAHLADLQPHLLVVLGYRMWDRFEHEPPVRPSPGPIIIGAGKPQTYYYHFSVSAKPALAYGMRHPAAAFSWRTEHPFLMDAIRRASLGVA